MIRSLARAGLALTLALAPVAAAAQSIVAGELRGSVADSLGRPVPGVLVTLRTANGGSERVVTVGRDGGFTFPFLSPGRYQVQADALGWRPVLVDGIRMESGRTATLRLLLARSTPAVQRRDTLAHASAPEAVGAPLAWVDAAGLAGLPAADPGLAPVLTLSGAADAAGGVDGLPERLTAVYLDGQPFRAARHPDGAADAGVGGLVPRTAIGAVGLPATADVEWSGVGAAQVAVSTGVDRGRVPQAFGLWGGKPGWSGSAVPDPAAFDAWWVGGGATLDLVGDTARVHVALERGDWSSPRAPLLADSVVRLLGESAAGLDRGGLSESSWTAGSARLEWALPSGGALQAGLTGATFSHAAPGPAVDLRYLPRAGADEGTDLLASASLARPIGGPVSLEVRVGGSLSRRRFGDAAQASTPATVLLDPATAFGGGVREQGEVRRADGDATLGVHFARGPHEAKLGVHGTLASHRYDLLGQPRPVFLFGPATAAPRSGVFAERTGSVSPTSFSVPAADAFAQYRWAARPGVTLTVAGRVGFVVFPIDEIRPDPKWFHLTNLANVRIPTNARSVGGLAHAAWDPTGNNRTVVEGGFSLEQSEPDAAALYEVIANSGQLSTRRAVGDLSAWPSPPVIPATARSASLTLLDPEYEPPRTSRGVVAVAHRFAGGATVRLQGTVRRTELMLRRADLNRPTTPALSGEGGRPVLSPVVLAGGVVGAPASGWRRFNEYDAVWALNADGWSRYRGLTVELDRPLPGRGLLFASYGYSRTTDNLVGLAAGDPWATLSPGIAGASAGSWDEGTSDLDLPHRGAAGLILAMPGRLGARVSAVYRGHSGRPFTPMVRRGLDVNGDGSWSNDVAWIPEDDDALGLARRAGCGRLSAGAFPARNSCRGSAAHQVDIGLALGPLALGGAGLELTVEVTNATDQADGVPDDALFELRPDTPLSVAGGRLTVPYRLNPAFGSLLGRADRGRQLRLGIRLGPPR